MSSSSIKLLAHSLHMKCRQTLLRPSVRTVGPFSKSSSKQTAHSPFSKKSLCVFALVNRPINFSSDFEKLYVSIFACCCSADSTPGIDFSNCFLSAPFPGNGLFHCVHLSTS